MVWLFHLHLGIQQYIDMTMTLAVEKRTDETTSVSALRSDGKIPAVVYGPKQEAISIVLDGRTFDRVFKEAGESTIINLDGLDEPTEVLVKEVAFSAAKGGIIHVDFYAIERGKEMTANISFEFIGESPIEKSGGVVNKVLHEVEVSCRPSDLPSSIEIDLSTIETTEDKITVADIKPMEGVTINVDPEEAIVVASEAQEEVEEEPEAVDMDAVAVEEKGKSEGGEEGEAATE